MKSARLNRAIQPEIEPAPQPLPYGQHLIEDDDVAAVVAALRSDLLAQGPQVAAFEAAVAERVGAAHAVACSSGTAALHLALAGLDIKPGDVCIVPPITFLATATAAMFCGAEILFSDVDPDTGLMTPNGLADALDRAEWLGARVKAVLPVHLSGRLCDTAAISAQAKAVGAAVVEDACHALGSRDAAGSAGSCAASDAAVFSFHPVKTIAAGEGGMVTLNDGARAERLRRLRNHGVSRDAALMEEPGSFGDDGTPNPWSYEQLELGFNYRMNEMEAPLVRPVRTPEGQDPSLHLYTVLIDFEAAGLDKAEVVKALIARGIGVQVHYIPLYRQPVFRRRYGQVRMPGAEAYFRRVLALPLFPAMSDAHVDRVVLTLAEVLRAL